MRPDLHEKLVHPQLRRLDFGELAIGVRVPHRRLAILRADDFYVPARGHGADSTATAGATACSIASASSMSSRRRSIVFGVRKRSPSSSHIS